LTMREMIKEKMRYPPMSRKIICGAGWPFPISWKVIRVISA
jgi:hypothetical protein